MYIYIYIYIHKHMRNYKYMHVYIYMKVNINIHKYKYTYIYGLGLGIGFIGGPNIKHNKQTSWSPFDALGRPRLLPIHFFSSGDTKSGRQRHGKSKRFC